MPADHAADMVKLQGEVRTCRQATNALRSSTLKQQKAWREHRQAHHDMKSGKISKEEMQAVWTRTIAAGDALDQLVEQAAELWRRDCAKT